MCILLSVRKVLRVRPFLSQVTVAWGIHADRAFGGDRDHRHLDRDPAAGADGGAATGRAGQM